MKRSLLDGGDGGSGSPKFRQQEEDDITIAIAMATEEWRSFNKKPLREACVCVCVCGGYETLVL